MVLSPKNQFSSMVPSNIISSNILFYNHLINFSFRYSKEDATDQEMREAATRANAIGFIEKNEFGI